MDHPGSPESKGKSPRDLFHLSRVVFIAGGLIVFIGILQAILELLGDGSVVVALFHLILVGTPGVILAYAGYWLPRSDISPRYYPRIIVWILGGTGVMFGFILLRDFHPGVTVEWSVGTQSIALMIGSIGGLLVGISETRVAIRTEELKARTHELKEREQHLEQQNERLEDFANIVSHDLRNPLNVANGRLKLAQEDCNNDHLSHVEDAHERMDALITDLLTLAQQGQVSPDRSIIHLTDIVESCWQNVRTKDATIITETDSTIRAEESRLRQLFENLIRNSVEHGGSDVSITVGDLDSGFYFEDDGSGILPAERDAVFKNGYSTSEQGTGFGLSIVKQVVEAHGWDIRVTDSSEGGTRFEIIAVEFVAE